jgi:hypothetical protein
MKKQVKKLIEQAIGQCGEKMHDVKKHLAMALREVQKDDAKEKKKSSSIHQQWTLNLQTGSLQNLNWEQAKSVIGQIDGMISDESKRLEPRESAAEFLLD